MLLAIYGKPYWIPNHHPYPHLNISFQEMLGPSPLFPSKIHSFLSFPIPATSPCLSFPRPVIPAQAGRESIGLFVLLYARPYFINAMANGFGCPPVAAFAGMTRCGAALAEVIAVIGGLPWMMNAHSFSLFSNIWHAIRNTKPSLLRTVSAPSQELYGPSPLLPSKTHSFLSFPIPATSPCLSFPRPVIPAQAGRESIGRCIVPI